MRTFRIVILLLAFGAAWYLQDSEAQADVLHDYWLEPNGLVGYHTCTRVRNADPVLTFTLFQMPGLLRQEFKMPQPNCSSIKVRFPPMRSPKQLSLVATAEKRDFAALLLTCIVAISLVQFTSAIWRRIKCRNQ